MAEIGACALRNIVDSPGGCGTSAHIAPAAARVSAVL
jgi:hypothetical protein